MQFPLQRQVLLLATYQKKIWERRLADAEGLGFSSFRGIAMVYLEILVNCHIRFFTIFCSWITYPRTALQGWNSYRSATAPANSTPDQTSKSLAAIREWFRLLYPDWWKSVNWVWRLLWLWLMSRLFSHCESSVSDIELYSIFKQLGGKLPLFWSENIRSCNNVIIMLQ